MVSDGEAQADDEAEEEMGEGDAEVPAQEGDGLHPEPNGADADDEGVAPGMRINWRVSPPMLSIWPWKRGLKRRRIGEVASVSLCVYHRREVACFPFAAAWII